MSDMKTAFAKTLPQGFVSMNMLIQKLQSLDFVERANSVDHYVWPVANAGFYGHTVRVTGKDGRLATYFFGATPDGRIGFAEVQKGALVALNPELERSFNAALNPVTALPTAQELGNGLVTALQAKLPANKLGDLIQLVRTEDNDPNKFLLLVISRGETNRTYFVDFSPETIKDAMPGFMVDITRLGDQQKLENHKFMLLGKRPYNEVGSVIETIAEKIVDHYKQEVENTPRRVHLKLALEK